MSKASKRWKDDMAYEHPDHIWTKKELTLKQYRIYRRYWKQKGRKEKKFFKDFNSQGYKVRIAFRDFDWEKSVTQQYCKMKLDADIEQDEDTCQPEEEMQYAGDIYGYDDVN